MSEVVHIKWYATVLRGDLFADAVAEMAPITLRYGATRYAVHRSEDDRFWESPELVEFRARYSGKYQAPITYTVCEEVVHGELGPQVPLEELAPAPSLAPSAT